MDRKILWPVLFLVLFTTFLHPSNAQVPGIINYQGRVVVNGTNFDGSGQFKFALVNAAGSVNFWSNDGTAAGEPASAVSVSVSKGLYSVLLGQSPNPPIPPSVFSNSTVYLRVWFNDGVSGFQQLAPDQRIAAVGYALMADRGGDFTATSLHAGGFHALADGRVGVGTTSPLRTFQIEREMVIKGNGTNGVEYNDWPYASLSIRRSDDYVLNGVSMLSFGYRNDPIYVTDDSVANIRLYDPQQVPNAPTSAMTTQLRIASPGPVVLQPSGGKVGIGTATPAEQLEVAGRIVVADSANANPKPGTIRWTGNAFEGFDGARWGSLSLQPPAGFVLVPGGTFTMGSAAVGGNAVPEHQVTLSSFYLAKYEVTYELWYRVKEWALTDGYYFENPGREGYNGSYPYGEPPTEQSSKPVTEISWRDAIVWCNARSQKEGLTPVYTYTNGVIRDSRDYYNGTACDNAVFNTDRNGYRLPTEAEWEYAARYIDGITQTPGNFASGAGAPYNNTNASVEVCWYAVNSIFGEYEYGSESYGPHPVGTKRPNHLGIHDMCGNVTESCWDWYGPFSSSAVTNPTGPSSGSSRVLRGLGWNSSPVGIQIEYRFGYGPSHNDYSSGFRCARNTQ